MFLVEAGKEWCNFLSGWVESPAPLIWLLWIKPHHPPTPSPPCCQPCWNDIIGTSQKIFWTTATRLLLALQVTSCWIFKARNLPRFPAEKHWKEVFPDLNENRQKKLLWAAARFRMGASDCFCHRQERLERELFRAAPFQASPLPLWGLSLWWRW